MKARDLIENSAFGPESLALIGKAFDDAWAQIAGNFSDPAQREMVRLTMAEAILAAAGAGATAQELESVALQAAGWDVGS